MIIDIQKEIIYEINSFYVLKLPKAMDDDSFGLTL